MRHRVLWDNGHSSGLLPGLHATEEEAEEAGRIWKEEMVFADPDPESAEEVYSYEVVPAPDVGPALEASEALGDQGEMA